MNITNGLELFLIDRELKGNTKKTIDNYKQQINYFIDYIGHDKEINELELHDLKNYQSYLSNKERYENHPFKINQIGNIDKITLQSYIRQLRVFIKYIYDEGLIQENLCEKFKLPKAPKKVIDVLDKYEIEKVLNAYSESTELQLRNKCIMALMIDSGLRINEVLTLEYDNVHFINNYIKVNGKGNKERLVPMGLITKKLLLKYINYRSIPNFESKILFIDKNKKPMTYNSVKMIFTRLRNKTGIERLHPHILRHTFATNYLINGGEIFSLQQILGHTSLDMVRKYSHLASSYIISNHKRLSPLDNIERRKYNY